MGLKDHLLKSTLGNTKATGTALTRVEELAKFLGATPPVSSGEVARIITSLTPTVIDLYTNHLSNTLGRAPSTVYSILVDVKAVYEWAFSKFAPQDMGLHGIYRAMEMNWSREFKIYRRLRDRKTNQRSLEALIEAGRLPPEGLAQLQEFTIAQFKKLRAGTKPVSEGRVSHYYYYYHYAITITLL